MGFGTILPWAPDCPDVNKKPRVTPVWRRTPLFCVTILATLCIKGLKDHKPWSQCCRKAAKCRPYWTLRPLIFAFDVNRWWLLRKPVEPQITSSLGRKCLQCLCLQCFDAVGSAARRASDQKKLSGEVLAWSFIWSEVLHMVQLMPLPPHHLLLH